MQKRRNLEYILGYSNVTPFLWFKGKIRCFYCCEPIKDPDVLREHTLQVHQFANLELVVHDRTTNNRNKDAAVKIDVKDIQCKLCLQNIADLEQLIRHMIIAHDAQYDVNATNCVLPFILDKLNPTCGLCDMKFSFFEYLLRHANKNHLSHNYMCDICGTSFQGENHMKMHHRYYHKEGGYPCEYCDLLFSTLSKKIQHEKNVHLVNLAKCAHCEETFKSPYFKRVHMANVHGVEELKIKCPHCPKVYPQESIMSRHMRRVHLKQKNVECEVCGDKFFGPYDLKLHMIKHNGEKRFMCTVCGNKFAKKSSLNAHMSDSHNACNLCWTPFDDKNSLAGHLVEQHGDSKVIHLYFCAVCGGSFSEKDTLASHILEDHVNSTIEQDFECTVCSTVFTDKNELARHILDDHVNSALNQNAFSCTACGISVTDKDVLAKHILEDHVKSEVEVFLCCVCGVSFSDKINLAQHIIYEHVKSDNTQKQDLNLSVITPEQMPSEQIVITSGIIQSGLHSDISILFCDLCKTAFTTTDGLKAHLEINHPEYEIIEQDSEMLQEVVMLRDDIEDSEEFVIDSQEIDMLD